MVLFLCYRNTSPEKIAKREISFQAKKALGLRKGWKIIADDTEMMDGAALKTVVSMIKDMEYQVRSTMSHFIITIFHIVQGCAVPDRITVKVG